jgi:ABC-2 type transport system permease protein
MNFNAIKAIYRTEMARMMRTVVQSIVAPVLSTSLYFVIFGAAIGSRISEIDGIAYGAFIVPGLIMLSIMTESISNSSFAIYFPKFTGTIFELLSAPVSFVEVVIGYVGAAASKSIVIGLIILSTASFFIDLEIAHPVIMLLFLVLISVPFSLFGFILGVWADGWEKLTIVPVLVIMPLTFLGGTFYSISMLPPAWQTISLFNPVVYLISGFRWAFYENADVAIGLSLGMVLTFLVVCLVAVWWIFKTGYKLRP